MLHGANYRHLAIEQDRLAGGILLPRRVTTDFSAGLQPGANGCPGKQVDLNGAAFLTDDVRQRISVHMFGTHLRAGVHTILS